MITREFRVVKYVNEEESFPEYFLHTETGESFIVDSYLRSNYHNPDHIRDQLWSDDRQIFRNAIENMEKAYKFVDFLKEKFFFL